MAPDDGWAPPVALGRSVSVHDVAVDSPLPGVALPDEDVLALVGDVVVARVQRVAPHLVGQVTRALHFERFDTEGGQPGVKDPLPYLLNRLPSPCDIGVGRQHGALLGVEAGATGGIPLPKRVDELAGGRSMAARTSVCRSMADMLASLSSAPRRTLAWGAD